MTIPNFSVSRKYALSNLQLFCYISKEDHISLAVFHLTFPRVFRHAQEIFLGFRFFMFFFHFSVKSLVSLNIIEKIALLTFFQSLQHHTFLCILFGIRFSIIRYFFYSVPWSLSIFLICLWALFEIICFSFFYLLYS